MAFSSRFRTDLDLVHGVRELFCTIRIHLEEDEEEEEEEEKNQKKKKKKKNKKKMERN